MSIFRQIITSYSTTPGKGIPIGNLTSQYFANHYLAVADHYIQEQLKASGYVRYMDDMVIWDNDKQSLLDVGESIRSFTGEQLKLQLKPYCLNKTTKGLPFLGYVLFDKTMHLNQRSRKRFRARMNQYWYNLDSGILGSIGLSHAHNTFAGLCPKGRKPAIPEKSNGNFK